MRKLKFKTRIRNLNKKHLCLNYGDWKSRTMFKPKSYIFIWVCCCLLQKVTLLFLKKAFQINWSMEQNRKPRNETVHLQSADSQRGAKTNNAQFSTNGVSKTTSVCKKWNWTYLTLYTKINSKWIKELNIRPENIRLLEENMGNIFLTLVLTTVFWTRQKKSTGNKSKHRWGGLHQTKKEMNKHTKKLQTTTSINKIEGSLRNWNKYLQTG